MRPASHIPDAEMMTHRRAELVPIAFDSLDVADVGQPVRSPNGLLVCCRISCHALSAVVALGVSRGRLGWRSSASGLSTKIGSVGKT